jgi:hypothetical protein
LTQRFEDGILVSSHDDPGIIEKEIISIDFQEDISLRSNDTIDRLDAFMGEPIDVDILLVVDGRSPEESGESCDKFRS